MKTIDLGRGVRVSTPILTAEEAAAYLGVSLRAFWRLAGVPRHDVGGSARWDCRELDEWVQEKGGRNEKSESWSAADFEEAVARQSAFDEKATARQEVGMSPLEATRRRGIEAAIASGAKEKGFYPGRVFKNETQATTKAKKV